MGNTSTEKQQDARHCALRSSRMDKIAVRSSRMAKTAYREASGWKLLRNDKKQDGKHCSASIRMEKLRTEK
jgi:hypothetical protein